MEMATSTHQSVMQPVNEQKDSSSLHVIRPGNAGDGKLHHFDKMTGVKRREKEEQVGEVLLPEHNPPPQLSASGARVRPAVRLKENLDASPSLYQEHAEKKQEPTVPGRVLPAAPGAEVDSDNEIV